MIYLETPYKDAVHNLALEEYVFQCLPQTEDYFILWQNMPAVIIGRYQNTPEEVNLQYAKENNIAVVRRLSGGGAVYHDLGNLNFTFVSDGESEHLMMERFAKPVIEACHSFGIKATMNGRNDLVVGERKFSGNAGYQEQGRVMHHGTILINSNLTVMQEVLQVKNKAEYCSKGTRSVKGHVLNLSEYKESLTVEQFKKRLIYSIFGEETPNVRKWSQDELAEIEKIAQQKYASWEWNIGNFPLYTMENRARIAGCGTIQIYVSAVAGQIMDIQINGDFIGSLPIEELCKNLCGMKLKREIIRDKLKGLQLNKYIYGINPEQLAELICSS